MEAWRTVRACGRNLTETVEAEGAVIKEIADVARLRGHGAEGVRAAGGEGVNADKQHVHQQGPGVAVREEVQGGAEDGEPPQEVPADSHNVVRRNQNDRHRLQTAPRSSLLVTFQ